MFVLDIVLLVIPAAALVWVAMNEGEASAQSFIDYLAEKHGCKLDTSRRAVRARKWPTYGFRLKRERREHEV